MKKILLINPPSSHLYQAFKGISLFELPLNLTYIASVLEGMGYDVEILDLNFINIRGEFVKLLKEKKFDIIGFTSTTPLIKITFKLIQIVKLIYPEVIVILGGWHASTLPLQIMKECKDIDFIIVGEGEETIKDLVSHLDDSNERRDLYGIEGIVFRSNEGKIIINKPRPQIKDLDTIPFPARHLINLNNYKGINQLTLGGVFREDGYVSHAITSRGCFNRCIFCADHVIYKQIIRTRTPKNVVLELKEMVEKFNIRVIGFIDPNFLAFPKRVKEICKFIIEEKLNFSWGCQACVGKYSLELFQLMKEAGCERISFGVETGSPKIMKIINKKHLNIKNIKDNVKMANIAGITTYIFLIFGLPDETVADLNLTRQLIKEIKPDYINMTMAVPYPGTDLYEISKMKDLLKDDLDWENYIYYDDILLSLPNIQKRVKFQKKIFREFYLSIGFIFNALKNLKTIYHLVFFVKAFIQFLLYMIN